MWTAKIELTIGKDLRKHNILYSIQNDLLHSRVGLDFIRDMKLRFLFGTLDLFFVWKRHGFWSSPFVLVKQLAFSCVKGASPELHPCPLPCSPPKPSSLQQIRSPGLLMGRSATTVAGPVICSGCTNFCHLLVRRRHDSLSLSTLNCEHVGFVCWHGSK
jgi:hypothetical protein